MLRYQSVRTFAGSLDYPILFLDAPAVVAEGRNQLATASCVFELWVVCLLSNALGIHAYSLWSNSLDRRGCGNPARSRLSSPCKEAIDSPQSLLHIRKVVRYGLLQDDVLLVVYGRKRHIFSVAIAVASSFWQIFPAFLYRTSQQGGCSQYPRPYGFHTLF